MHLPVLDLRPILLVMFLTMRVTFAYHLAQRSP